MRLTLIPAPHTHLFELHLQFEIEIGGASREI